MGEHGRMLLLVDDHVGLPLPLAIDHVLILLYLLVQIGVGSDLWLLQHLLLENSCNVLVRRLVRDHGPSCANLLLL